MAVGRKVQVENSIENCCLQLPVILSLNDLRKLKATISPHLDEVLFNTNSGPVKIKLAVQAIINEYSKYIKSVRGTD